MQFVLREYTKAALSMYFEPHYTQRPENEAKLNEDQLILDNALVSAIHANRCAVSLSLYRPHQEAWYSIETWKWAFLS